MFHVSNIKPLHPGVYCNMCDASPIVGIRYTCTMCDNYDLCETCEASKQHPSDHPLIQRMSPLEQKDQQPVAEFIAICIDTSGSMQTPFEADGVAERGDGTTTKSKGRTRLEAVKQMFYGFRDQTTNFMEKGVVHYLGLISYDSHARVHTKPTDQMAVFEAVVDEMRSGGSTAIFEAITTACSMLAPFRQQHPKADFRVLCLSDGMNNCRQVGPDQALAALNQLDACVDMLLVGDRPDADLLKLVNATSGECYQINSLSEGFEALESQGVISLNARRNGAPRPQVKRQVVGFSQLTAAPIRSTQQTQQSQVKQQASQVAVTDLNKAISSASSAGGASQKRIAKELFALENDPLPAFRVFPATREDGSIGFLKILMLGAAGTPYEGGVFELLMEFPATYPFQAPRLTFVTPIYHYAVNAQGGMCASILRESWSPAITLSKALNSVYSDLMECDQTDPTCCNSLRSWLSELKRVNLQEYNQNAREHTARHANESLPQASARITGGATGQQEKQVVGKQEKSPKK